MRKYRKMILSGIILTCLCTGCKGPEQEITDDRETEETVLEVYAGQSEKESLGLLTEAFEEENPEISVNLHFIPDSEYTQQMMKIKNQEAEADCIFFPDTGDAVLWRKISPGGRKTAWCSPIIRTGMPTWRKKKSIP